jgi:hypothetical protein
VKRTFFSPRFLTKTCSTLAYLPGVCLDITSTQFVCVLLICVVKCAGYLEMVVCRHVSHRGSWSWRPKSLFVVTSYHEELEIEACKYEASWVKLIRQWKHLHKWSMLLVRCTWAFFLHRIHINKGLQLSLLQRSMFCKTRPSGFGFSQVSIPPAYVVIPEPTQREFVKESLPHLNWRFGMNQDPGKHPPPPSPQKKGNNKW